MVQTRVALILAWTLTVMIALGIGVFYDRTRMIKEGTTDKFWAEVTGGVDDGGWRGNAYCFNGEYYYSKMYISDIGVFHVDPKAVEQEMEDRVRALDEFSRAHPDSWQAAGYKTWSIRAEFKDDDEAPDNQPAKAPTTAELKTGPKLPLHLPSRVYVPPKPEPSIVRIPTTRPATPWEKTLPTLIYYLQDAQDVDLCKIGSTSRLQGRWDALVEQRVIDNRCHWAAALFEFVFLSGLVWFSLWPFIHNHGRLRTALRLGLFPLLFFLPTFFGYVPNLGFTGNGIYAYPSGGVLYPRLMVTLGTVLWLPLVSFVKEFPKISDTEFQILSRFPQILRPLAGGFPNSRPSEYFDGLSFGSVALISVAAFVIAYLLLLPFSIRKVEPRKA